MLSHIRTYKELSKSGIVALVLISVLGGYLVGHSSEHVLDPLRLLTTLVGILLLASGSSALNQVQERQIDSTMPRTAKRPLPSGRMSVTHAVVFVAVTLVTGLAVLAWLDPVLLIFGAAAVVLYNGLYTLWWKRRWAYAAIPGAIPGALPIWMGHVAASHQPFHPGGIYLFFILFFWQMPHFWVLALKFRGDYEKGGFPTLSVRHGQGTTVFQIVLWCLAYIGIALIGPFFLPIGTLYLVVTIAMSLKLLYELVGFVKQPESGHWLRFFLWVNFSLIFFLAAAAADLWKLNLAAPMLTR
jgi:heme o synthase